MGIDSYSDAAIGTILFILLWFPVKWFFYNLFTGGFAKNDNKEMSYYCSGCDSEISPGDTYCFTCGSRLVWEG